RADILMRSHFFTLNSGFCSQSEAEGRLLHPSCKGVFGALQPHYTRQEGNRTTRQQTSPPEANHALRS
ncbi:hypothetical protein Pcinc_019266, partial [Petrolisthes cinctipes]